MASNARSVAVGRVPSNTGGGTFVGVESRLSSTATPRMEGWRVNRSMSLGYGTTTLEDCRGDDAGRFFSKSIMGDAVGALLCRGGGGGCTGGTLPARLPGAGGALCTTSRAGGIAGGTGNLAPADTDGARAESRGDMTKYSKPSKFMFASMDGDSCDDANNGFTIEPVGVSINSPPADTTAAAAALTIALSNARLCDVASAVLLKATAGPKALAPSTLTFKGFVGRRRGDGPADSGDVVTTG